MQIWTIYRGAVTDCDTHLAVMFGIVLSVAPKAVDRGRKVRWRWCGVRGHEHSAHEVKRWFVEITLFPLTTVREERLRGVTFTFVNKGRRCIWSVYRELKRDAEIGILETFLCTGLFGYD